MRVVRVTLAMLALASAAGAQAAESKCVPAAEAEALAVVLLPDAVSAVAQQCAASLPPTATLRSNAAPIVGRWRAEGAAAMPGAAAAVRHFMDGDLKGGDPAAMLTLMRTAMIGSFVKDLKPGTCADIDRAVTLASPLPARNIAGLFVMLAQSGASGTSELPICKAVKP